MTRPERARYTAAEIAERLDAKRSGRGWQARCPAHEDNSPSLSINEGKNGGVLLRCHAGCSFEAITAAMQIKPSELFADTGKPTNGGAWDLLATHVYRDAEGRPEGEVRKYLVPNAQGGRQKTYRPYLPGAETPGLHGVNLPPYLLQELLNRPDEAVVFIVEGEKDADRLTDAGLTATTNQGGAGKWRAELGQHLRGADVVILPDNDEPGRKHARDVAAHLLGTAGRIRIVELPGLPHKGDVSDWLDQGHTIEELQALVAQAREVSGTVPGTVDEPEADPADDLVRPMRQRPVPSPDVYHGLAGDYANLVAPSSEADPVSILVHFLVGFGSAAGRAAHFMVEATRHGLNEYALIVGSTASGRKGTAAARGLAPIREADPDWDSHCAASGLGSGEGVVSRLRDAAPAGDKGAEDPGVTDKRLLVIEEEFASVLRITRRESSILSPTLRQAWDGRDLNVLNKNSPLRATKPHLSLIGHISPEELRQELTAVDKANGLANRFLILWTTRSRLLPLGGPSVPQDAHQAIVRRVRDALGFARRAAALRRSEAANQVWATAYPRLTEPGPGLLGALLGRAEAHVLRLSMLYAVLDCSAVIEAHHVRAALALWEYSEQSVRFLFADVVGDPVADQILKALQSAPDRRMTRTQISKLFSNNQPGTAIDRAIETLRSEGLVDYEKNEGNRGRPTVSVRLSSVSFVSFVNSSPVRDSGPGGPIPYFPLTDNEINEINAIESTNGALVVPSYEKTKERTNVEAAA